MEGASKYCPFLGKSKREYRRQHLRECYRNLVVEESLWQLRCFCMLVNEIVLRFQKVRVGKIVRLRTKVHDVPYHLKAARSLTDCSPALACSFLILPCRKRLASSPFTWPQCKAPSRVTAAFYIYL
jgi:hypothetical protein